MGFACVVAVSNRRFNLDFLVSPQDIGEIKGGNKYFIHHQGLVHSSCKRLDKRGKYQAAIHHSRIISFANFTQFSIPFFVGIPKLLNVQISRLC